MLNKKEKKNRKKLKIENLEKQNKNVLEIWCRGSYSQNLDWIHAVVSVKLEFMDNG